MRTFCLEIEPDESGLLDVGDGQSIYWETSGNPDGKPAVFLQGGPGGATQPDHRRLFVPAKYRLELLRQDLSIERWLVSGASWGNTLALAYAETHPGRVSELVLRKDLTLRKSRLDWLSERGEAEAVFPDAWEGFLAPVLLDERHNLIQPYLRLLSDHDPTIHGIAVVT